MARRVYFYIVLLACFTTAPNLFSQPYPLSGVNGWSLGSVYPLPDTLNTGMQIVPYEPGSNDTVQVFHMAGNTGIDARKDTTYIDSDFSWNRLEMSRTQFCDPDAIKFNFIFNEWIELESVFIEIGIAHTNGSISGAGRTVELRHGWQTITFGLGESVPRSFVNRMGLSFYLFTSDFKYIRVSVALDSLVFIYNSGADTLVDDFGDYIPFPDVTDVVKPLPEIPSAYILHQNHPNPFNPVTKIRYEIPELSPVNLSVYNSLGQKVKTLVNVQQPSGIYEATFNAASLCSGIYIYVLETEKYVLKRKMILLK